MKNCAKEPVHAPQCVQANGMLLAVDIKRGGQIAVSDNSDAVLLFV